MEHQQEDPVVIHLDDPVSGITRAIRVIVIVLLLALVATPYVFDPSGNDGGDVATTTEVQNPARDQICQPAIELPSALDSVSQFAVPSFMRLCDWFAPPNLPSIDSNSRP